MYATCPDAKYRNGEKALEYGNKACELTEWKGAWALDTLAAAYGELGDFEKAVTWQAKAIAVAKGEGWSEADFDLRLSLYKQNKPYREGSSDATAQEPAASPSSDGPYEVLAEPYGTKDFVSIRYRPDTGGT